MISKKLWIGVGAGAVVVAIAATAVIAATLGSGSTPIALAADVACSEDHGASSTVTWTLQNASDRPLRVLGFEATDPGAVLTSPIDDRVPAAEDGRPGSLTFTQTIAGTKSTAMAVTAAGAGDTDEITTATVSVEGIDCRAPVDVGTLTVTQPSCDAADPGLDGTLLVEGADPAVRFAVSADDGTPVRVEPGSPYTVILEKDPVTVVVTPETDDDVKLDGYDPEDWTVTLGPVPDECS